MSVVARRRALAATALAVLAAVGILLVGRTGNPAIATGAARLVPDNALVYVHLSTDPRRPAVRRAVKLAGKFPSFGRLRDSVLRKLSVNGDASEMEEWLGKEASLALLDTSGTIAGSLVVVGVRDESGARRFLAEGRGSQPSVRYRGVPVNAYGEVSAAFVDHYLVIGQEASVHRAIDLAQGRGRTLADDPQYRRAVAGLPGDRVADAYVTTGGVRRLLEPAGGLLGAVGALLDHPGLRATGLALTAEDPGARLVVHALGGTGPYEPFSPSLPSEVPSGALAYIGVRGFDRAAARLLAATGEQASTLARVVAAIPRELIAPLQGEVALLLTAPRDRTVLSVVAHAGDERRTRAALSRLAGPLRKVLPRLRTSRATVAGVPATVLRSGRTFELDAAVFGGKLVIATAPEGIAALRARRGSLQDERAFRRVVPSATGRKATTLVFLDFDQLLDLAERTGLDDSRAYRQVRADLARVRAVGFSSSGRQGDTTAEIGFDIP
ncbi:MAG TPA: DUF3352 domain-containing protein [Solirubrobacteraceae bacterium]